jgi:CheY-like chemotaxis protein
MPNSTQSAFQTNSKFDVLVVENDPAAARLTLEAFREAGLAEGIISVPDGEEALAYLHHKDKYAVSPHPDLICLDLHLPRKSGLQVLAELKSDKKLKLIPVIVVSGSDNPEEVREAYELHASCYIRKPDDLDQFLRFIQVCFEFWGTVVTLPSSPKFFVGVGKFVRRGSPADDAGAFTMMKSMGRP